MHPINLNSRVKSRFRHFCSEKWFEHKDEILAWTGSPVTEYDDKYYFRQHRWLLKKLFKESLKND
jgi:hypothetical protein